MLVRLNFFFKIILLHMGITVLLMSLTVLTGINVNFLGGCQVLGIGRKHQTNWGVGTLKTGSN